MSSTYIINYSDQVFDGSGNPTDTNRQFTVAPLTTNGTIGPGSNVLDPKAVSSSTTLLLYGKSNEDYGARIQENMVHLLENFSSDREPYYAIDGQLWHKRDGATGRLYVFDVRKHTIIQNQAPNDNKANFLTVAGDETTRLNVLGRSRIRSTAGKIEDYAIVGSATLDIDGNTVYQISPAPDSFKTGWFLGGWQPIRQDNLAVEGDINLANLYKVVNLNSSLITNDTDVVSKGWVNTLSDPAITLSTLGINGLYDVDLTGGGFDGDILIYDALNGVKPWVNVNLENRVNTFALSLSGTNTMTGNIDLGFNKIINSAQINAGDAASTIPNKQYVDQLFESRYTQSINNLSDVHLDTVAPFDVLIWGASALYPGSWTNISNTDFPVRMGILHRTGTDLDANNKMDGPLILSSDHLATDDWTNTLKAASADYVDTQIAEVANDGYIDNMSFDYARSQLDLYHSQYFSNGNAEKGIIIDSTQMRSGYVHDPTDMNNLGQPLSKNPFLEQKRVATKDVSEGNTYPGVPLQGLTNVINNELGKLSRIKDREIATGPLASNPVLLDMEYTVGFNALSVYKDGLKQLSSTFGSAQLAIDVSGTLTSVEFIDIQGTEAEVEDLETGGALSYQAFVADGDWTSVLPAGKTITVTGSTGAVNDGVYTVQNSQFIAPDTSQSPPVGGRVTQILINPAGPGLTEIADLDVTDGSISILMDNTAGALIWGGFPLGLDELTMYNFRISANSEPDVDVFINGSLAKTFADLAYYTNRNTDNAKMILQDGWAKVFSSTPGDTSTVTITDGIAGGTFSQPIESYRSSGGDANNPNWIAIAGDWTDIYSPGFELGISGDGNLDPGPFTIVSVDFVEGSPDATQLTLDPALNGSTDLTPQGSSGSADLITEALFNSIKGGRYGPTDSTDPLNVGYRDYYYRMASPGTFNETTGSTYDFDEIGIFGEQSSVIEFAVEPGTAEVLEIIADNVIY